MSKPSVLKILNVMLHNIRIFSVFLVSFFLALTLSGQIDIDDSLTPAELVQQVLLGNGVSVSNITFNGQSPDNLAGNIGRYFGVSDVIEFPEALVMKTGNVLALAGGASANPIPPLTNDPDLQDISNQNSINDCAILEFDFVPNGDSLQFRYVFASEEYPGFTCSSFNDAFGFFLSGPGINGPFLNNAINIALVPGTNIPVAVNTINSGFSSTGSPQNCLNANPNFVADSIYFVANQQTSSDDVQVPGLTVTLTAYAEVICGETYHIKLAIGDASDGQLDSSVFLEAGSFTSNSAVQVSLDIPVGVNDSTLYEGCGAARLQFVRPLASTGIQEVAYMEFSGSALNGVDFLPALPDSVTFPLGVDTVNFLLTAPVDANFEGQEYLTVTITNIASDCSGAELTSEFTFYLNEADPLQISGFDGALVDCFDEIDLFPTITGGYGQYTFNWSNGANSDSVTVSPGFTTTYFLTVGDTCGVPNQQTSFDVEVPVYPPVQVDLGEDFIVNECDVIVNIIPEASGGFGNYYFDWEDGSGSLSSAGVLEYLVQQTATVELTVTDDCGATGFDDVVITVPPVEVTALLPDSYTATSCLNSFFLPGISEGGIGQKSFSWYVDNDSITTTTQNFFEYLPSYGQNVVVRAFDECQNEAIDSTFIIFNFPKIDLVVSPDTAICPKTFAVLRANATGGTGDIDYKWERSDSASYRVAPANSREFVVTVSDTCAIKISKRIKVEVREPIADFDYTYVPYYGIALKDYSQAINPTFFWNFGDGESSDLQNPTHFYDDINPFRIVLTTTDDIGCSDTASFTTKPPIEIFIPTAFSPNGDGFNDLFGVVSRNLYEFEMQIFDRWGRLVFQTDDLKQKWNGAAAGASEYFVEPGLYSYFIRYKGVKEEDTREITGNVTIIR